MDYENFDADDFCLDESFQEWVQRPTPSSNNFWNKWIEQHPEKVTIIEEARQMVSLIKFDQESYSKDLIKDIWNRIDENTIAQEEGPSNIRRIPRITYFINNYWKVASVALVFLLSAIFFFSLNRYKSIQSFSTKYGETKRVVLKDGSIITLNSNSFIKFRKNFEHAKIREVWVNGEAFFSVTHKSDHKKFIVHTQSLNVEVLGTEFNVNTRRDKIKVVLSSGSVKLHKGDKNDQSIYMRPGEFVEYSSKKDEFIRQEVKPDDFSSWRNNQLIFNGTSLEEIAAILEDNYGFKVEINNPSISSMTFTATVPVKNNDLSTLLRLLEEAFNLDITQKNNTITIKNK